MHELDVLCPECESSLITPNRHECEFCRGATVVRIVHLKPGDKFYDDHNKPTVEYMMVDIDERVTKALYANKDNEKLVLVVNLTENKLEGKLNWIWLWCQNGKRFVGGTAAPSHTCNCINGRSFWECIDKKDCIVCGSGDFETMCKDCIEKELAKGL